MKLKQHPKVSRQTRIIRISRSSVIHPVVRVDSRIPSVDSWLSSAPSIKEPKKREPPKKVRTQPSTTKTTQRGQVFRQGWLVVLIAIFVIFFICSIVAIVLVVKLEPTTVTTITSSTTSSH